jgi:hypothetical protein
MQTYYAVFLHSPVPFFLLGSSFSEIFSLNKCLFATCPSVHPTGRISMKFGIKDFYENYVHKQLF